MRERRTLGLVLTVAFLLLGSTAIALPASGAPSPSIVEEDFEHSSLGSDGSDLGFFTVAFSFGGGLFEDPQLGQVVDDGTGNRVYQLTESQSNQAFIAPEVISNFDLSLDVTLRDLDFRGDYGVVFRITPGEDGYFLDSHTFGTLRNLARESPSPIAAEPSQYASPGIYNLRIFALGELFRVFRDGQLVLTASDSSFTAGLVGLVEVSSGIAQYDNIVLRRVKFIDIDIQPGIEPNLVEIEPAQEDEDNICELEVDDDELEFEDAIIAVGLLSREDFDASEVNPATLRAGDPNLSGTALPIHTQIEDLDGNGVDDLLTLFCGQEMLGNGALLQNSTELLLVGETLGGSLIGGIDSLLIVEDD